MKAKRAIRAARTVAGPVEPLLELDDIQGIAAPGFLKPHQALVYLRFPNSRPDLLATRAAIADLVATRVISSGTKTLKDRRDHRKFGKLRARLFLEAWPNAHRSLAIQRTPTIPERRKTG
jgi:hypothetical protein